MKSRKIASKLGVAVLTAATLIGSMGTVPAMAATNEQTIGINGTVKAISTLDITVPVQPLEFTIDSNDNFSSPAKTITNNTAIPVYAYVTEVYGASGNYPALVNANAYGDWSGIEHEATIARMALQLNSNELSAVYQTDSVTKSDSGNYIALGSIAADNGELNLQLTGNYGKTWNNATDINFSYTANMLFTTIEGNFGTGGSSGSGGSSGGGSSSYEATLTAAISENYSTYASAAESSGYTTLAYNTDFTSFVNGNTQNDETITIKYIGWKDNANGTADIYVKYDSTCDVYAYTFGPGSSTYNTFASKQSQSAGNDVELTFTIAKSDLQTLVSDNGLNIAINPQVGSASAMFFINGTTISAIHDGVTGA